MTKQRRSFSAEFKREVAGLVLDQGYSHIEACRSLGVVASAWRRWVNQLPQERTGVTPQSNALTPEQQKIQELEARIARLEREKSILKKATALLMSEEPIARTCAGHAASAISPWSPVPVAAGTEGMLVINTTRTKTGPCS